MPLCGHQEALYCQLLGEQALAADKHLWHTIVLKNALAGMSAVEACFGKLAASSIALFGVTNVLSGGWFTGSYQTSIFCAT